VLINLIKTNLFIDVIIKKLFKMTVS